LGDGGSAPFVGKSQPQPLWPLWEKAEQTEVAQCEAFTGLAQLEALPGIAQHQASWTLQERATKEVAQSEQVSQQTQKKRHEPLKKATP